MIKRVVRAIRTHGFSSTIRRGSTLVFIGLLRWIIKKLKPDGYLSGLRQYLIKLIPKITQQDSNQIGIKPLGVDVTQFDIHLFYYPNYGNSNPYQPLLYSECYDNGINPIPLTIDDVLDLDDTYDGLIKNSVFHIHWPEAVLKDALTSDDAQLMVDTMIRKVSKYVNLGGKLIWTVHNLISHNSKFRDIELNYHQQLSNLASGIHVHSSSALETVKDTFQIDPSKLFVLPHGNYMPVYPNSNSNPRRKLKIQENKRVFLFFGRIRPYKGLESLIKTFKEFVDDHTNCELLIVGKAHDAEYLRLLNNLIDNSSHIYLIEEFIRPENIQLYLNSADCVVLPFTEILTSGSALLALSFGRPIIAPRLGALVDLVTDNDSGLLYDPKDYDGLYNALSNMALYDTRKLEYLKLSALEKAKQYDWKTISQQFCSKIGAKFQATQVLKDNRSISKTAIIILNYNNLRDTVDLIRSLHKSDNQSFDIYVADNQSQTRSVPSLYRLFPHICIIQNPKNGGYAYGNNQVLRYIVENYGQHYKYFWILNPDTEVYPDTFSQLWNYAESHPEADLMGTVIYDGRGKRPVFTHGKINLNGPVETIHAVDHSKVKGRAGYSTDYITGSSIFFRRSVIDIIGYMPETYFLYFEETDWCLQAKQQGLKLVMVPSAGIIHKKRSSDAGMPTEVYLYYYTRNRIVFTRKFAPDHLEVTLKSQSEQINNWLSKITLLKPDYLPRAKILTENAIKDGLNQIVGYKDMLGME